MKKIFLATLIFAAFTANSQTFKPKVNLTIGKTYESVTTASGSNSVSMMGQQMENPIEITTVVKTEIASAKGDSFELASTLAKLKLSFSIMGMEQAYDSDSQSNSDMFKEFGNVIGKKTVTMVDAKGNSNANGDGLGLDKAQTEMLNLVTGGVGLGTVTPFWSFPSNFEIAMGETKTIKEEKSEVTYKLISLTETDANFEIVDKREGKTSMNMFGQQFEVDIKSKNTISIIIDVATGLVKKRSTVLESDNNIDMGGQMLPAKTKMTSTTVLTEK